MPTTLNVHLPRLHTLTLTYLLLTILTANVGLRPRSVCVYNLSVYIYISYSSGIIFFIYIYCKLLYKQEVFSVFLNRYNIILIRLATVFQFNSKFQYVSVVKKLFNK